MESFNEPHDTATKLGGVMLPIVVYRFIEKRQSYFRDTN